MFAPAFATPFTSFAPMPPTPMQATLTVSLGARRPRPSTWRGTMGNATPAPTSPTNFRLEMRLRAMMVALLNPPPRGAAPVRPQAGTAGQTVRESRTPWWRIEPDPVPVVGHRAVRALGRVCADHAPRQERPDGVAEAVRDQVD